jgi:hypothetical protein
MSEIKILRNVIKELLLQEQRRRRRTQKKRHEAEIKYHNVEGLDRDLFYILRVNNPPRSYHTFSQFYRGLQNIPNNETDRMEFKVNLAGEDDILSIQEYNNLVSDLGKIFDRVLRFSEKLIGDRINLKKETNDPKRKLEVLNKIFDLLHKDYLNVKKKEVDDLTNQRVQSFKQTVNDVAKQLFPLWFRMTKSESDIAEERHEKVSANTIAREFTKTPEEKRKSSYPYPNLDGFKFTS